LCSCWSPFRVRLFHFRGNWKPIDKSPLSWLQNCRAEYRPRWSVSIYIYIQALMRVQHSIFGQFFLILPATTSCVSFSHLWSCKGVTIGQ
jgi:hypothetical protein